MRRYIIIILLLSSLPPWAVINAADLKDGHGDTDVIEIEADRLDVYTNREEAIFTGNVTAIKEDMTLKCKRLQIFYDNSTNKVNYLIASGDVNIVWQGKEGNCNQAKYLLDEKKIILTGDVVIIRGEERISAQIVTIDMVSGYQMAEGQGGKVKIRIETEKETGILRWDR